MLQRTKNQQRSVETESIMSMAAVLVFIYISKIWEKNNNIKISRSNFNFLRKTKKYA